MYQMLKPIMAASYILGLALLVISALLKGAAMTGSPTGFEAGNWGIGACALFLCALASARMMDTARK